MIKRLLIVDWVDITSTSRRMTAEEAKDHQPGAFQTVGWEHGSNRRYVRLSTVMGEGGISVQTEIIPRGCITNIERLTKLVDVKA